MHRYRRETRNLNEGHERDGCKIENEACEAHAAKEPRANGQQRHLGAQCGTAQPRSR